MGPTGGLEECVVEAMNTSESFVEWFMKLVDSSDESQLGLIVAIIWALWREINDRVWNQKAHGVVRMVLNAREAVEEWQEAQGRRAVRERTSEVEGVCHRWHRPPEGVIKCNIDAAVFEERGMVGAGLSLRDWEGRVVTVKMLHREVEHR
ncbi:hypothetical protein LINPERPRIM_LOCUS24383 [Linum perenne]